MSDSSWEKVEEVFQKPANGREAYAIRSRDKADKFSDARAFPSNAWTEQYPIPSPDGPPVPSLTGRRVGNYKIVREIGRGGMGVVYLAERADGEFHQSVALKVVKRGMDADFSIRRFRHERQIIHRDIKPGNILVTPKGFPKLLDFGIAKILDPDLVRQPAETTSALLKLMTPEYASPEQVRGEDVTAASDIYSLGVLLYELCTGVRPYAFPSRAPHEVARVVCEEEPQRPSLVGAACREFGDAAETLDAIVLKALRKEPRRRYASVEDFALSVTRFLSGDSNAPNGQPVGPAPVEDGGDSRGPAKSLAIVPLKFLRALKGADASRYSFLGVGLADALTTRLSKVRQIKVRPAGSVSRVAGRNDSYSVGEKLDVDYVLEGHLQTFGERLRVTVQLLKMRDRRVLWASHFDETEADIFQLQDSISDRIIASLVPHLTGEEQESLRHRGTDNALAFEAYLHGRIHWHTYTIEGIQKSVEYFHEAIVHDPTFAPAHTGIADYHNWMGVASVIPPAVCFTAAKEAARKAIELDGRLAEAYASLAFATWAYDWDFAESERLFRRAFALNPDYALAHEWSAYSLSSQGRHDEAIAAMERAERLDPYSPAVSAMFAFCLHNARRYEEAYQKNQRALDIDPNYYVALQGLGWLCPPLGRFEEAVEGCRRAVAIRDEIGFNKWALATTLAIVGEREEARGLAAELEAQARWQYIPPYYLALVYANLGEPDAAFSWLDKAFKGRDYWTQWLRVEPRFDPLREDPRFPAYVQKIQPLHVETPLTRRLSRPHESSD